jgi:PP-loop superfamily ATP-utilizing enzyme
VTDQRLLAAESLLREEGFFGAQVAAEGPDGEIAAVRVDSSGWARLMEDESAPLIAGIRAIGFRYVALDLLPLET